MGEPIRTWAYCLQATRGVAAADASLQNMFFEGEAAHTPHPGHIIPPLHNGTVMQDQFLLRGNRYSEVAGKVPLMFSQSGHWMNQLFASATSAAVGTGGSIAHLMNAGPATAPKVSTNYVYDGVEWEKVIDASVMSGKFNLGAAAIPMIDLQLAGKFGTSTAPSPVPAVPTVTWKEPADLVEQTFFLGGVDAALISGSINVNNNFTPFWTAKPNADISRMKRGYLTVDIDLTLDFTARSGSAYDAAMLGNNPGVLQFLWEEGTTSIGTQAAVSTTVATAVTAIGYQTVTPAAMTNIVIGSKLLIDSGTNPETVYVTGISGSTFTALFNRLHAGAFTVVHASTSIFPAFQMLIFKPLLTTPVKAPDGPEIAQHVTGKAGYNTTAGTVLQGLLINNTASYPGA